MSIYTIEGNIGSGKSTLLAYLQKKMKNDEHCEALEKNKREIIFLREPVDMWEAIKDEKGVTMLEKFYQDQEKYSFPFQMMAYISRLALLKEAVQKNPNAIIITERSLYTDKHVFAKMLYECGKIEHVNYQIYQTWFDTFAEDFPIDGIIYVKTKYEICNTRIKKRSRNGESNIPVEYLKNCESYHNTMMDIMEKESNTKLPRMELNGDVDIYDNPEILEEWFEKIQKYLSI